MAVEQTKPKHIIHMTFGIEVRIFGNQITTFTHKTIGALIKHS